MMSKYLFLVIFLNLNSATYPRILWSLMQISNSMHVHFSKNEILQILFFAENMPKKGILENENELKIRFYKNKIEKVIH